MGAWGYGYFEDDSALDFMADLEQSDDPMETIRNTFEAVIGIDYIESDEGSAVIVASTYVDRQVNGTTFSDVSRDEPLLVDTFPDRHPGIELAELKRSAVAALRRVLDDNSELKVLWEESGEFDEWRSGVEQLIMRLDQ